jgi:hypothetical protein
MASGRSASARKCRTPNSTTAIGWPKSSVPAAFLVTSSGSRRSPYIGAAAFGCAGQQLVGVSQHDRVVIDIDNPGVQSGPLRHLVSVVLLRDARADVQELPVRRARAGHRDGPSGDQRSGLAGLRRMPDEMTGVLRGATGYAGGGPG